MRPRNPRKNTANRMQAASVIAPSSASFWKFVHATGARFRPIRATIAPETTGGMSLSIQPVPVACTRKPMPASNTPATNTPSSAWLICSPVWSALPSPGPSARIGAMNANELPR